MSIFYYCVCIIIYSTIYIFFNIWNLIIIVVICLTTLYFYFHFSNFLFFQFNINAPFVLMENLMWRYFFSFSCVWKKNGLKEIGQNLATKLVITLGYNLTQYLFIGDEFWQIHHWITSSSYILYTCKISRKLKINSYVINKLLLIPIFATHSLQARFNQA